MNRSKDLKKLFKIIMAGHSSTTMKPFKALRPFTVLFSFMSGLMLLVSLLGIFHYRCSRSS